MSDLYEDFLSANVYGKHFGPFPLSSARPIFQPNAPAMPAADNFAGLHNAFTERKSKVRTEIFNGVNAIVPLKQGNLEPCNLDRMAETFGWQFR